MEQQTTKTPETPPKLKPKMESEESSSEDSKSSATPPTDSKESGGKNGTVSPKGESPKGESGKEATKMRKWVVSKTTTSANTSSHFDSSLVRQTIEKDYLKLKMELLSKVSESPSISSPHQEKGKSLSRNSTRKFGAEKMKSAFTGLFSKKKREETSPEITARMREMGITLSFSSTFTEDLFTSTSSLSNSREDHLHSTSKSWCFLSRSSYFF